MGFFSKRSSGPADGTPPSPLPGMGADQAAIVLPPPASVATREEADALLDEIGALQGQHDNGARFADLGKELTSRVEGVVEFFLRAGYDQTQIFDVLVAPLSEWAMSRLMTPEWVDNPNSDVALANRRTLDYAVALRHKYQYLNPENLG